MQIKQANHGFSVTNVIVFNHFKKKYELATQLHVATSRTELHIITRVLNENEFETVYKY